MPAISGLKAALDLARAGRFDVLRYKIENKLRRIDLRLVPVSDLGIPEEKANWYSDSGGPDLERVLRLISAPRDATAIDIGSGKGGAVITLAKHFRQASGLELAEKLIPIAKENAKRAGVVNVLFFCGDATDFRRLDDYTHIYMYNPFPEPVMIRFLANLKESLVRRPRQTAVIYKNPVCHDSMLNSGIFATHFEFSFPKCHHAFKVYFNSAHSADHSAKMESAPAFSKQS